MTFNIVFLGTGGSMPTKDRGLPAVSVEHEGEMLLFDCGEGTQMQAMRFGVNLSKLRAIFVTHTHGDHVIGIAGLVRTLAISKRQAPLRIFVPKGEEKMILSLLTFDRAIIDYPIVIEGIGAGTVYKGKDFTVSAFKLSHSVPTVGYVLKENDRPKFIKEKCIRLGIKGVMFQELIKKGYVMVKGKRIKLADVSTKTVGKKMVYATDTRPTQATVTAAKDADLLIHESSFAHEHHERAKERSHSTAREAAHIAKKARVKMLVLFHISARYKAHGQHISDAKEVFKNSQAAKDGLRITI